MARKDVLAAGARSAQFIGGVGETDYGRNLATEESRLEMEAPVTETATEAPKLKRFVPTADVLLVRRFQEEYTGKIQLADTTQKEKPAEGIVLAVGPQIKEFFQGDHVVFEQYAGAEFKLNGEVLLLMRHAEVLGTLEEVVTETPVNTEYRGGICIPGGTA
jgi:chaperonin GroES